MEGLYAVFYEIASILSMTPQEVLDKAAAE